MDSAAPDGDEAEFPCVLHARYQRAASNCKDSLRPLFFHPDAAWSVAFSVNGAENKWMLPPFLLAGQGPAGGFSEAP